MHAAVQRYVDENLLAGANAVVLKDNQIIDQKTWGHADIAAGKPIEMDTIFRIYSNTKIITSVAAMCLLEDGKFSLDDPIANYLPELADLKVLAPDAESLDDTVPLASHPTVRQVFCHNAGFTYGFLQQSPVLDAAYTQVDMQGSSSTLAEMITKLSKLPLAYQPGTKWQYSVSTDVLARLVEVWSGKSFGAFLEERLFIPLEMTDTGFFVPMEKRDRLATNYLPVDMMDPMKGGLNPVPPEMDANYIDDNPLESGGGGLVSTINDYTNFISMLVGGGEWNGKRILKSDTVEMMQQNQLADGVHVELPNWIMPDTDFGLGLALKTAPQQGEPDSAVGEYHWGGMAGTHSWVAPKAGIAALIFTQRLPGFWHPFSHEFKRLVYQAAA